MIKRRKYIKESKVSAEYSQKWKEAFEDVLEEFDNSKQGNLNGSDKMYFTLTSRYGDELPYEGFIAFDRIENDNLILHAVYPEPVSILEQIEHLIEHQEEPDIDISSIESEEEKDQALEQINDYINDLKNDLEALKQWHWGDAEIDIAETMNENGRVEEIEIELPDDDWIDFDEFDSEEEAVFSAMKDDIASEISRYIESVSREAEDISSDANSELEELIDELSEKLSDAKQIRKEIEDI